MASNQRENERKAKKLKKQAKIQRIIWGIIILVTIVLIVMKVVEADFNSIKDKYTDENGKINVTAEIESGVYPYQLDSSSDVRLFYQSDKLNVLTSSSCSVINPKDAAVLNHFVHGFANPIVKTAGNYFVTIDQGATRLRLDNLKKNEFETESKKPVLCADVCKTGTFIYATASDDNKSTLYVVSRSHKTLLKYNFNDGYIVAVAIDETGKRCAFSAINSRDAKLLTTVYTINVGDKDERAAFEFEGTNTLDLHYCDSSLYFVGDNGLYTVTSQKKLHEVLKSGSANTVCFGYTKDNELLYVYSDYSSANENHLINVTPSGRKRKKIELKKRPKTVTSAAGEICVLFPNEIKIYSLSGGDEKESFKCDDGVTSAYKLSSRVFVIKGQQLDVID